MNGRQRIALRLERGERLLGDENSITNSQTPTGARRRRMMAARSGLIRKAMIIYHNGEHGEMGAIFYVSMQHGGQLRRGVNGNAPRFTGVLRGGTAMHIRSRLGGV